MEEQWLVVASTGRYVDSLRVSVVSQKVFLQGIERIIILKRDMLARKAFVFVVFVFGEQGFRIDRA